ncbi:hypothetical protein H0E87_017225 [Populus deltoides]|uniref:Uncharacterized protein n=1 Tax=Populus deltoides TaxID=3696 RepID=A0A8T2XZG8_POPDE|nr:hypothetical protein H0E87_017225 [Populus deltoides]
MSGILLVLLLAFLLKTLPLVILAKSNVYIVYMGDMIHDEPELVQESHHELLSDIVGRILSSHTARSWDFLHIEPQVVVGTLSKRHSGVGSIIGVMDTGIWPESESFRDVGGAISLERDMPGRRGI